MNSKSRRFFLYLLMAVMVVTQVAFSGTGNHNTSSESSVQNTNNTDNTENTGNTERENETEDRVQEQPTESTTLEVKKNTVAAGVEAEVAQAVMIRVNNNETGEDTTTENSYDALADYYLGKDDSEEKSEYQDMIVCYVDPYLPVRKDASRDSSTLGKLYPGSYADIVERGDTWSKVKSGNLEGWVQNMYVCFDQDAEDLADQLRGTLSTGVTLAEEKKQQEELAKKKAAAAAAQKQNGGSTSAGATSVSSYDEILLAAIVDWEAGNESQEGQNAVAYVVLNRANSGYGGNNTIQSVIAARGQFGGVTSGGGWSEAFQKRINNYSSGGGKASCRQAAADALAGVNNPLNAPYLHFNTRVGSVSQSQQIGNHIFY